jgi:tetratricopeptide (TPR) repeat protein
MVVMKFAHPFRILGLHCRSNKGNLAYVDYALKQGEKLIMDADATSDTSSTQYSEAVDVLQQAVESNPDDMDAWRYLRWIASNIGFYEVALRASDHLLQFHAEDAEEWTARGYILLKLKRYAEAIKACEQAIQLGPFQWVVLANGICAIHVRYGFFRRFFPHMHAVTHFTRLMMRHRFDFPENAVAVAQWHLHRKMYRIALIAFKHALDDFPDYIPALQGKIETLRMLGREVDAQHVEVYLRAVAIAADP